MGFLMNFLQIGRISCDNVALNIITCFSVGVARKISWTSRRISVVEVRCGFLTENAVITNLIQHFVALIENEVLDVS